jgi:prepilin-type N-terminal cleavage/methylation domain-containing protein
MNNKAFTLIELLVVISIIGVISSVIFVSFSGSRDKARLARAQQFDAQISHVLGAYAVGIWDFEDGAAANVSDRSGYKNDGVAQGSYSWISNPDECISDKCIALTDGYVSITNLTNTPQNMTFEGWFKKTNSYWDAIAFLGKRHGSTGWMLYRNSGDTNGYFRWYMHYVDGGGTVRSYSSGGWPGISGMKVGQWYHIAVTRTADGATDLYLNSKRVDGKIAPGNFDHWSENNYGISIGSEKANDGSWDCDECESV